MQVIGKVNATRLLPMKVLTVVAQVLIMRPNQEGCPMAEKLDPSSTTSPEELLLSVLYTQEALVNVLEKKGLLTKEEVLKEIQRLRAQHPRGA